MAHLKPRQHYIDRYDRVTVEKCRWAEKAISTNDIKKHTKKNKEKDLAHTMRAFNELHLYFVQGECYANKETTIADWMSIDEERDRFCANAKAPEGIACHTCRREMIPTFEHLETSLDESDRMLYMYDCPKGHLPRRILYDNGEEWKHEKPKCTQCNTPYNIKDEDTKELFKTVSTCPSCGHIEVSEIERIANKESKDDPDYETDRARFCDAQKGAEYVTWMQNAKELSELMEKHKEKEQKKELYDRVEKLSKLSIPQVKQHLNEIIEETSYINLVFEKPLMERVVSVGFSVEDPTEQVEYDSRTGLTRLLRTALEDTNWRLMTEGISCRLGVLSGRIRVYENEDELAKLLEKKK